MNISFYLLFFRHIFKTKKDDDKISPYYRLQEEKQYSDLQVDCSHIDFKQINYSNEIFLV